MSTLKVTNIESPSGGGVSAKISDIGGGQLSNRNLIINGAMRVAQRSTSSITSGFATVDRFEAEHTGGAVTQSQGTLTTAAGDAAVYNLGFRHYLRQTNTTATSGVADHRNIRYRPEGQDIATFGWNYTSSTSYITLSFWVRASVSQEFYGYIRTENGTERVYTFSTGTLTAGTWTKVTKTIPGDSALEIPNDNTSGVQLFIAPFWGTNFTDPGVTLDTWRNYDAALRTPEYATTWTSTTNATFDLTGVQLEVGNLATSFEHRSYADELQRCQRYYYKHQATATGVIFGTGWCDGTTQAKILVNFPVEMRDTPASLDQSGTANDYSVTNTGNVACNGVVAKSTFGKLTGLVNAPTGGSLGTNDSCALRAANTNAFLAFSAELL